MYIIHSLIYYLCRQRKKMSRPQPNSKKIMKYDCEQHQYQSDYLPCHYCNPTPEADSRYLETMPDQLQAESGLRSCYRHCEFFEDLEHDAEFRLLGERFVKVASNRATSDRGEWWYLFPSREIVKASKGWSDESEFSSDNNYEHSRQTSNKDH